MTDILTPEERSRHMARVRGKDTKPEMQVRRGLHALGLRYRLHARGLPGRPDMVLARHRAVVFVHGCFWHAHGCGLSKLPATRRGFWRAKLQANRERDRRAVDALVEAGWRVLVVWECALRGSTRLGAEEVARRAARFIREDRSAAIEVSGLDEIMKRSSMPASCCPSEESTAAE